MAQPVLEGAVGGLTRGFEDRAIDAKEPAVIATADALLINQPEFERGSAMRAMQFQQPDRAAFVAKGDQVFPQDPQPSRDISKFEGLDDGLPETSQIFTARGAGADSGQLLVFRRALAVVISAIAAVQK
jgi:hypothetical protein